MKLSALIGSGRLAYPKWMLPHASAICEAYRQGCTLKSIAHQHRTTQRYIVALLKDLKQYREKPKTAAVPKPQPRALIKHPSERTVDVWIEDETPEPPKMRKCVGGCGKHFLSTWKGNRICDPCGSRVGYAFNGEYTMGVG